MAQKKYRVVLDGIRSSIIVDSMHGEHATYREAKEELVNYLKLHIKAFVDRLGDVITESLSDI